MRLLQRFDVDNYLLIEFDEDSVPPYAILSHTWGDDEEEVKLEDLTNGNGQAKAGYEKLRFCGEQAWKDGIQYFWIDTCCIDKTNKAEHSHAIESMFRWYEVSTRCYVFLSDVPVQSGSGIREWEPSFKNSRWFTRGWTLQELLAPTSVEFFSKEGLRLGDKMSLTQQIHEITAIPQSALKGEPLHHFSVGTRLRWKGERKTKFVEDGAYSIAGLFSVSLAPVYGEGAELAYRRLNDEIRKTEECIRDLRLTDPRDDQKRIEETKGGLLRDSYRWILDNASFQQWRSDSSSPLLWIKGDPGKGKTMLLCGITNELRSSCHNALVSSFFCQATDSRINSGTAVLRGLLYLLVDQQPRLAYHVRKRYDAVGSRTLFEDANAWTVLKDIITHVLHDSSLPSTYLIVDALDECAMDLVKLIDFIAKQSSRSSPVKWLISSRNWPEMEQHLEQADDKVRLSLELNSDFVTAAVHSFISQKVSWLSSLKKLDDGSRNAVLDHLLSNADSTFLWVSLVCQVLQDTSKRHIRKKLESFPPGLSALYERMMHQIRQSDDAEVCLRILATNTLVYRPLTIKELPALVEGLDEDDPDTTLELVGLCGSFLTLRNGIVYFVHQSAKDFLLDQAADELFPVGRHDVHHSITARSLDIMFRNLHRDMYDLRNPSFHFIVDRDLPPDPDPLSASRYSCVYWWNHLCESSEMAPALAGVIKMFLSQKYLYWLEALSLCGHLRESVSSLMNRGPVVLQAIISAENMEQSDESSTIHALIQDAHRFIMYHLPVVEAFPLQLYASALMFSPSTSIVRHCFQHEKSEWYSAMPVPDAHWSACLATIENHGSIIAISPRLSLLAIANDRQVRLLDMNSYAELRTLQHSNVSCLEFSSHSDTLATASRYGCIKIWDATKGVCLITFEEGIAEELVRSMSFGDGLVASASTRRTWTRGGQESRNNDRYAVKTPGTIKVWNVTREPTMVLLGGADEYDNFHAVALSPDSKQLVSGSRKSIQIWDISNGTCQMVLQGHTGDINCVTFASNPRLLGSASSDRGVKIWDVAKGQCLNTLQGHFGRVNSITFSPDAKWLVSVAEDRLVILWDVETGTLVNRFKGHTDEVTSVAFSHPTRLVSASRDGTVKVWDATSPSTEQSARYNHHRGRVDLMAYSRDSKLLATFSINERIQIWNTEDGTLIHSLTDTSPAVNFVWSYSNQLVIGLAFGRIQVWNIDRSEAICTRQLFIETFSTGVRRHMGSLAVAHNSTRAALSSTQRPSEWENPSYYIELWDLSSALCTHRLEVDRSVQELYFSPDDAWLYTNIGTISTSPPYNVIPGSLQASAQNLAVEGAGYSLDETWITYAGKKVLWVPPEHRPGVPDSTIKQFLVSPCGQIVATFTDSGRVWFIRFDASKRPGLHDIP